MTPDDAEVDADRCMRTDGHDDGDSYEHGRVRCLLFNLVPRAAVERTFAVLNLMALARVIVSIQPHITLLTVGLRTTQVARRRLTRFFAANAPPLRYLGTSSRPNSAHASRYEGAPCGAVARVDGHGRIWRVSGVASLGIAVKLEPSGSGRGRRQE